MLYKRNMSKKIIGLDCPFSGTVVEIPQPDSDDFSIGSAVVYKDEDGKEEFGVVKFCNALALEEDKVLVNSKILRPATPNDLQKMESHMDQNGQSLEACQNLVKKYELDMQVFRAGVSFDGTKVHFMFTADERVDFREMVKDLAKILKKQIYLRQVGPRDKAKAVGGYGKCGRPLCCSSFLGRLESISMDMVRDQGLESKGSSKLSGACGKLLCCLKYEVETYRALKSSLPDIGSVVRLKKSVISSGREGNVVGMDVLNQKLKIVTSEKEFLILDVKDVDKVLKSAGKASQDKDLPRPASEEVDENS